MRAQAEWNVMTHIARARLPTSASTRSRISWAALLVNVIARISPGAACPVPTRWAIRWVRTRVLPEPAPARISSGPSPCSTAWRWGSLRPSSRASVATGALTLARIGAAAEAYLQNSLLQIAAGKCQPCGSGDQPQVGGAPRPQQRPGLLRAPEGAELDYHAGGAADVLRQRVEPTLVERLERQRPRRYLGDVLEGVDVERVADLTQQPGGQPRSE